MTVEDKKYYNTLLTKLHVLKQQYKIINEVINKIKTQKIFSVSTKIVFDDYTCKTSNLGGLAINNTVCKQKYLIYLQSIINGFTEEINNIQLQITAIQSKVNVKKDIR